MELTIGSDELLFFNASRASTDRILLTIEERSVEEKRHLSSYAINLTEEECEKLIEVLAGRLFMHRAERNAGLTND